MAPALSPGIRSMVASAFYFSLMSLGVKLAGTRLPSQEIVLVRGVLTVGFTLALLRRARVSPWGSRSPFLPLRGLTGWAALSCLYYALMHLPLAEAVVIQFTNPVFALVLSWLILKEPLSPRQATLSLLGLLGVVVITRPSALFGGAEMRLDPFAVGVGLAGAVFSALSYVAVRRLGRTEHPLVIVFYFTLVTVPASLPGVIGRAVWPTPYEWLVLLGIGLCAQAGQVYLTRGLQLEATGRATAAGYVQIVFAALWGLLAFGEVPDGWSVAGAAMIVGSTLLIALPGRAPRYASSREERA
jgi:drug/metabolite transporter (DMT)-like permease